MKLVTYKIKENELNIHASVITGARLGWIFHDRVIDVGFAQQWLIHFRQAPFLWIVPSTLSKWLEQDVNWFTKLRKIYQAIRDEDPASLSIHGEPVALPIHDVDLLAPLTEAEKLIYPGAWLKKQAFINPPQVISTNYTVSDCRFFYPGIAFMISTDHVIPKIVGCCLLNYWGHQERVTPALGPFLVTIDELNLEQPTALKIFHNDQLIAKKSLNLKSAFLQTIDQYPQSVNLTDGVMISWLVRPESFEVQPGDQVKIEMEHLGQLQNRVDKV